MRFIGLDTVLENEEMAGVERVGGGGRMKEGGLGLNEGRTSGVAKNGVNDVEEGWMESNRGEFEGGGEKKEKNKKNKNKTYNGEKSERWDGDKNDGWEESSDGSGVSIKSLIANQIFSAIQAPSHQQLLDRGRHAHLLLHPRKVASAGNRWEKDGMEDGRIGMKQSGIETRDRKDGKAGKRPSTFNGRPLTCNGRISASARKPLFISERSIPPCERPMSNESSSNTSQRPLSSGGRLLRPSGRPFRSAFDSSFSNDLPASANSIKLEFNQGV